MKKQEAIQNAIFRILVAALAFPYLHILEKQRNLHQKFANIFLLVRDVLITECECNKQDAKNVQKVNLTNFEILKI